jgi:uncharacterized membrane protein
MLEAGFESAVLAFHWSENFRAFDQKGNLYWAIYLYRKNKNKVYAYTQQKQSGNRIS